jgi:hypothetical protein
MMGGTFRDGSLEPWEYFPHLSAFAASRTRLCITLGSILARFDSLALSTQPTKPSVCLASRAPIYGLTVYKCTARNREAYGLALYMMYSVRVSKLDTFNSLPTANYSLSLSSGECAIQNIPNWQAFEINRLVGIRGATDTFRGHLETGSKINMHYKHPFED